MQEPTVQIENKDSVNILYSDTLHNSDTIPLRKSIMKSANISVRVNPEIKGKAEEIIESLGLSMTGAITIYLNQIVATGGIPFPLVLPQPSGIKDLSKMSKGEFAADLKITANEGKDPSNYLDAKEAFKAIEEKHKDD